MQCFSGWCYIQCIKGWACSFVKQPCIFFFFFWQSPLCWHREYLHRSVQYLMRYFSFGSASHIDLWTVVMQLRVYHYGHRHLCFLEPGVMILKQGQFPAAFEGIDIFDKELGLLETHLCQQNRVRDIRTMSNRICADHKYFKLRQDLFQTPTKCFFVPQPIQSIRIVLSWAKTQSKETKVYIINTFQTCLCFAET